jgi:hypothetical protein
MTSLSAHPSAPLPRLTAPGTSDVRLLADGAPPVLVVGTGTLSAGLTAAQWQQSHGDNATGISAASCRAPSDDWWFNGVDTAVGFTSTLVLSNPTPAIAVVDLAFYGPDGEISAVGGRGVALAPDSSQSVHADQGRVVAAVRTDHTEGATPKGSDWVPPAPPASTDVVVNAALPGQAQSLAITNPGTRQALVQIRVIDADGQFVPTGLGDVQIPPGAVVTKDLAPVTSGDASAVHLTSTVPVSGATITTSTRNAEDFAVVGSSATLDEPAVVPVVPGADLSLVFAGRDRTTSTLAIDCFDAAGASLSHDELRAPGSTLTTWTAPATKKAAVVVVTVESGSGVQGVAQYDGKLGVAALPVLSGTYTVTRPAVSAAVVR